MSNPRLPNDLWCADYKGEFMLADRRYCYPLTISDFATRYLFSCEALATIQETYAFAVFERAFKEFGLPKAIDRSYRWAMGWFIFSEAIFFAALFGALFYIRWHAVQDLASGDTSELWPGFKGSWPTMGPGIEGQLTPMRPTGVPLINALILLTSAGTLLWAHRGLQRVARRQLTLGLFATVALGVVFLGLQFGEHYRAYTQMGLTLGSGAYGATFFMLTGFHGLHVAIGATVLSVILARSLRGDFTPDNQFAFQAASWYWQFVDVIWLLMYVLVYWL